MMTFPTEWKGIKFMLQTTNQLHMCIYRYTYIQITWVTYVITNDNIQYTSVCIHIFYVVIVIQLYDVIYVYTYIHTWGFLWNSKVNILCNTKNSILFTINYYSVGVTTAWVLYKNALYKNLRGSVPRWAIYFQLYQTHSTLRIWGTLESDCQILKLLLIRDPLYWRLRN